MNYKILIVDDEPANLRILERLFRADHTIVAAASGGEALELLGLHDIAVIISDQRMPTMTGIDFLKKAAEMRPHTVRIILTGYTDVTALVEAINSGVVYKYVTKPWVNEDLRQTVKRALQHYETTKSHHQLEIQNERLQSRLKTTLESFVKLVARMLDLKEPNTYAHVRRTGDYAIAIGQSLDLKPEELEQLSLAALLHEYPNVNIPNHILSRTATRTEEEHRVLIDNFECELQMLASVPDLEEITSVLRGLHEQFDGNGYPDKLGDELIPLHARIIAVADAYDEMLSPHLPQPNLSHDEAILRLQAAAGKTFDPEIVRVFSELKLNGQINDMQIIEERGIMR